jgi:4-diphosphocytidyl-2-C-methyl-D-erythritol kinase
VAEAPAVVRRFAPAKLNLYLHVLGRRADGYHRLESLVVPLDLGDEIEAERAGALSLTLAGPFAPALAATPDNIVLRAARELAAAAGIAPLAALRLTKRLPVAAGLGGGSSDAAATLQALMALWGVALDANALDVLALRLGADVPVCLRRAPQLVGGIGERLEPAPRLPAFAVALVNPGIELATAQVFAALQSRDNPPAPPFGSPASAAELAGLLRKRRNDLEVPARALAPAVGDALAALAGQPGCLLARMSGSGATCFGLFAERAAAARAAAAIGAAAPGWWAAAAEPWPEQAG